MNVIQDRTNEIKKELAELHQTLKMSVRKAIRIGQLLTEQKEFVGHGLFLNWMEDNLDISERTARNYMKLYAYRDKTAKIADLHEAYVQIETIEAQERQSKEERNRRMISGFRKTGVKPEGWDRSLDYRIKKDDEAAAKQEERKEREFKEREQRAREHREQSTSRPSLSGGFSEALQQATEKILAKADERDAWKEKIRLSDGGKDDAFMDAIIEYLETLDNDTRRIEACNNIIKICRNISVELQRTSTS